MMRQHKQVKFLFTCMLVICTGLQSCKNDIRDPLQTMPLSGKINGSDWNYTVGKALYDNINRRYQLDLFNNFNVNDGCSLFGGNRAYVSFEISTILETINQPSPVYKPLVFHLPNSQTSYTATQGYIEIILINNFEIRGIINARFDEHNYLEGVFSAILC